MKNKIMLVLFLGVFTLATCQEKNHKSAPDVVKKTFQKMYPGEDDPDWHIDANGNYESNFKIKGIHYRADYSPDGNWIETENSIDKKDLHKIIQKKIKKNYSEYEITEVERVEHHAKGIFYDVEFKQKGKNKDVEFNAEGEVLNAPKDE